MGQGIDSILFLPINLLEEYDKYHIELPGSRLALGNKPMTIYANR
jgi:hypothetical protein